MISPLCAERLRALELVTRGHEPEQVDDFFPGLVLGGYIMPLRRKLGEDAAGLVGNRNSSHLLQANIDSRCSLPSLWPGYACGRAQWRIAGTGSGVEIKSAGQTYT
jgi:hypothetical protein